MTVNRGVFKHQSDPLDFGIFAEFTKMTVKEYASLKSEARFGLNRVNYSPMQPNILVD